MITFFEAVLQQLSIHKTGNKQLNEPLILSQAPLVLEDEVMSTLLMQYFLQPFEKVNELYRLNHSSGNLQLNEVYHFAESIFSASGNFHESSQQLARLLYEKASHPKIKTGELYVVHFTNLQIEGVLHEALGIFKSEQKEPYFTVSQKDAAFTLQYQQEAINIKKLDKGCLIFNTEKEEGYKVTVVDTANRSEALYWMDEFLQLKVRNDNYNQTNNVLSVYKTFVTEKMDGAFDISKADKIDLLNRSISYFKKKDHFDLEEFSNEVIANEQGIALFRDYKKQYEQEFEAPIDDSFSINNMAVKKQARVYKSVLKLDRNFHIYIHGNKELIEKGFDAEKNMNYYKVYFKEEQ
ncbi:MAG: nucleoid-associated protein [Chitinophagaceae bacterium]|nr:nucleoid-associated protein [Chitinophagaceae bacterium]